eukprot:GFUD01042055.1.p1 GENE.GFUD01042055.1~~GFUD01042055.1.p1  ORF type:complete len:377 (-),score=56.53 GFUD01042055.1:174-1304(-)
MLIPDHHTTKLGSKDFVFQCNKWPFSITCNPAMPVITESFIDLGLVMQMKVPMKKIECRNISYGGLQTKLVGSVSQTVQIVYDGVPAGTMHLKAKVIRNLTTFYNVDCIAGHNLYKKLTGTETESVPSSPTSSTALSADSTNDLIFNDSANELIFDADDSPNTWRRKRRQRFTVSNLSFTSSMMSSPASKSSRQNSPSKLQPNKVENKDVKVTFSPPDGIQPVRAPPHPPVAPVLHDQDRLPPGSLRELVFCGHHPECPCVNRLRPPQLQLLPPFYPVYLPQEHRACGPSCGCHHVHADNTHPPDPHICSCNPPRLNPAYRHMSDYIPPATCQHVRLALPYEASPPLPRDFYPCGNRCGYEDCDCLRQYEGRDWCS